jgi:hypothetical protein
VRFIETLYLNLRNRDTYVWLGVFIVSVVLYSCTAQRCFSWQDSGMFQWRILAGDNVGDLGLALAHPLYIIVAGWFTHLPFGDIAVKLNVFSGVGMAIALANTVFLVRSLTGKLWPGLAVAGIFAVMHTPWWLASITEVYTWNLAFFTLELLFFVKCIRQPKQSTAIGLFFAAGINWSIHNLALLALPVYFGVIIYLVVIRKLNAIVILSVIAAFIVGAGNYIYYIVLLALQEQSVFEAVRSALFGEYSEQVLNTEASWNFRLVNAGLFFLNFLNLIVPLALVGIFYMARKMERVLFCSLGLIFVLEGIFAFRYPVPDQFTFILPTLLLLVVSAGFGMCFIAEDFNWIRRFLLIGVIFSIVASPFCYAIAPDLIKGAGFVFKRERERPFRDELRYWAVPWKHNESSAELFASAALSEAAPNGMIITDRTSYYPLLLVQKRGQKSPGVTIQPVLGSEQDCSMAEYRNKLKAKGVYAVLPDLALFPISVRSHVSFTRKEGAVLYRTVWNENDPRI